MAEANVVELFREEPEEELGLRIVGGKDTPLGNIVIQEIVRDALAARDGRLAPGDHILEVRESNNNPKWNEECDIIFSEEKIIFPGGFEIHLGSYKYFGGIAWHCSVEYILA